MRALRFPASRTQPKKRRLGRSLIALLLLGFMFAAAWLYEPRESISASGKKVVAADGDSFTIGASKLRLHGIDAPEYRQTCRDAEGVEWQCGKAARAALEKRLLEPGLVCKAQAKDKYDAELTKLETLMKKRRELQKKELIDAFETSDRTLTEVQEFLKDRAEDA